MRRRFSARHISRQICSAYPYIRFLSFKTLRCFWRRWKCFQRTEQEAEDAPLGIMFVSSARLVDTLQAFPCGIMLNLIFYAKIFRFLLEIEITRIQISYKD